MSYTEAQKRAIYKYKQTHREKINEQAKKDYLKIKADPIRNQQRNEKMKIRRMIKKEENENNN